MSLEIDKSGPLGKVLNLPLTTGQMVAFTGIAKERFQNHLKIEIIDTGMSTFMSVQRQRTTSLSNMCFRNGVERLGYNIPFTQSVQGTINARYRKNSRRVSVSFFERRTPGVYFDIRCTNSNALVTKDENVSLYDGEYACEQIRPSVELSIPYPLIRRLVKKDTEILFVFRGKSFGLFRKIKGNGFEEIEMKKEEFKQIRYYHFDGDVCVKLTKDDILWYCTRGLCAKNSRVLIGCSGKDFYIGYVNENGWGRSIIGKTNRFNNFLNPVIFPVSKHAAAWEPPKFGFIAEFIGEEEMDEEEKKIMRAWWSAFITTMAKTGQSIDPAHTEVAEKYLG